MGEPIFDMRHAAAGSLRINTSSITDGIPQPMIKFLVQQIQRVVAESGYANVTVAVLQAPPTEIDTQGRLAFKVGGGDGSGLRGPRIEIRTDDGLLAGVYTIAMKRDGFLARIPPPGQLLESTLQIHAKKQRKPAIGSGFYPNDHSGPPSLNRRQESIGMGTSITSQGVNGPGRISNSQPLNDIPGSGQPLGTRPQQLPLAPINRANPPRLGKPQPAPVLTRADTAGNLGGQQSEFSHTDRNHPQPSGSRQSQGDPANSNADQRLLSGSAAGVARPPRPVPANRAPATIASNRALVPPKTSAPQSWSKNQPPNHQFPNGSGQTQGGRRLVPGGPGQLSNGPRQPPTGKSQLSTGQNRIPIDQSQPLAGQRRSPDNLRQFPNSGRQPSNTPRQPPSGSRQPLNAARRPPYSQDQLPSNSRQPQVAKGMALGQQSRTIDNKSTREKGGGGRFSDGSDISAGRTSIFEKAAVSKSGKKEELAEFKRLEKERKEKQKKEDSRRKKETEDRKKAEKRMKKEKKGKTGGYEDKNEPMIEKSGFYQEEKPTKRFGFF